MLEYVQEIISFQNPNEYDLSQRIGDVSFCVCHNNSFNYKIKANTVSRNW